MLMKRLLIVDDSKEIRSLLVFFLNEHFSEILESSSGIEALQKLTEYSIDLVISDLQMSNGDGRWLLTELQKRAHACKVIILSGDITATKKNIVEAGAFGFLPKPINVEALLSLVCTAIGEVSKK